VKLLYFGVAKLLEDGPAAGQQPHQADRPRGDPRTDASPRAGGAPRGHGSHDGIRRVVLYELLTVCGPIVERSAPRRWSRPSLPLQCAASSRVAADSGWRARLRGDLDTLVDRA